MSVFANNIAAVMMNQEILRQNQEKFDVIRHKIESRVIQIATPMEIIRMFRLIKANAPYLKENERLLEETTTALAAERKYLNEE